MRMKVYDISQEVFGCAVYPGDPKPERKIVLKMSEGAVCNLSAFSMCAHNGTHVDAPLHFCADGKSIDRIDPDLLDPLTDQLIVFGVSLQVL